MSISLKTRFLGFLEVIGAETSIANFVLGWGIDIFNSGATRI